MRDHLPNISIASGIAKPVPVGSGPSNAAISNVDGLFSASTFEGLRKTLSTGDDDGSIIKSAMKAESSAPQEETLDQKVEAVDGGNSSSIAVLSRATLVPTTETPPTTSSATDQSSSSRNSGALRDSQRVTSINGSRRTSIPTGSGHRVSIAQLLATNTPGTAPVIHVYPRKSIVSGSNPQLNESQDRQPVEVVPRRRTIGGRPERGESGKDSRRETIASRGPSVRSRGSKRVSIIDPEDAGGKSLVVGGMHKSKSSWSVKGQKGLRSGMIQSRSMGCIREPSRAKHRSNEEVKEEDNAEWDLGDTKGEKQETVPSLRQKELIYEQRPGELPGERESEVGEERISKIGSLPEPNSRENQDYYDYLMLAQRHASSNFIHKIGSNEIVYPSQGITVKIIGPFLLGDKIGRGAFGKVKEGLCTETLQRVAVKIINKKRLRKVPNGIENALREITMLRRLKHKNVVTLIDIYCKVEDDEGSVGIFNWFSNIEEDAILWTYDDGTEVQKKVVILKWYLVFEYCPCSLQTLLEQSEGKKLPPATAHKFFVQLVEGLEYLHSQSIIHRDIKPGNMLITADGMLKITDFGVAEQFSPYEPGEIKCQVFSGTHQFLSPEVADGSTEFDGAKVDIWAAGVTLYNMLTGRLPFELPDDGNLLVLYERIASALFDMPADFSEDLKDLMKGILTKDPIQRASLAQIQMHAWTTTLFVENQRPHPPILSYPIMDAKEAEGVEANDGNVPHESSPPRDPTFEGSCDQIIPCETTMIPYMEELHADELRAELESRGRFSDMYGEEDELPVDGKAPTRRRSFKKFFKNLFRRRSDDPQ